MDTVDKIQFDKFTSGREASCRHIAIRLVQLRTGRGLTQEKVSDGLDISQKRYGAWEESRSIPPVYLLVKLADYYGLTVDDFLQVESSDDFKPAND